MLSKVFFADQWYECQEGETVLDALLRHDVSVPFGCRSGVCHSCMMKAKRGELPSTSQAGLKETQKQLNYFLACQCVADGELEVQLLDTDELYLFPATVVNKTMLNKQIVQLTLKPSQPIPYHAGQFVNLYHNDKTARTYSIASVAELSDNIELHIKRWPNGIVSEWVHDELAEGTQVMLSEAMGQCFYTANDPQQNLLLIGTGSGLAPLYGIIKDALNQQHQGEIWLYHGSSQPNGLYLIDALTELSKQHNNFYYHPCVSQDDVDSETGFSQGRANEIALAQHYDLKAWRVFLCGQPEMVATTKKAAFLAGASLTDIFADPFEYST